MAISPLSAPKIVSAPFVTTRHGNASDAPIDTEEQLYFNSDHSNNTKARSSNLKQLERTIADCCPFKPEGVITTSWQYIVRLLLDSPILEPVAIDDFSIPTEIHFQQIEREAGKTQRRKKQGERDQTEPSLGSTGDFFIWNLIPASDFASFQSPVGPPALIGAPGAASHDSTLVQEGHRNPHARERLRTDLCRLHYVAYSCADSTLRFFIPAQRS